MGINLSAKYVQEFKITSGCTHPFMLYMLELDRCLELIVCCVDILWCLTTLYLLLKSQEKGNNFKDIQIICNVRPLAHILMTTEEYL